MKQWKSIHEKFQEFFQTEIRQKHNPDAPAYLSHDAFKFKKIYEEAVDKTFRQISATKKERQKLIYLSCAGNDTIISTHAGNAKIRTELAHDAINSIEYLSTELANNIMKNIRLIVKWISENLFEIPEIRLEMLGEDEELEELLMKKEIDSLIQRLARPATDIFLKYPRSRENRLKVLREYHYELMYLDQFFKSGIIESRGLVQFIANGRYDKFDFNFTYDEFLVNQKREDTLEKLKQAEEEKSDLIESDKIISGKNKQADEISKSSDFDNLSFNKHQGSLFNSIRRKKNCAYCHYKHDRKFNVCPNCNKNFPVDQTRCFDRLEFSKPSVNFDEVQLEIDADINEFMSCMKNSVFYQSGMQR